MEGPGVSVDRRSTNPRTRPAPAHSPRPRPRGDCPSLRQTCSRVPRAATRSLDHLESARLVTVQSRIDSDQLGQSDPTPTRQLVAHRWLTASLTEENRVRFVLNDATGGT